MNINNNNNNNESIYKALCIRVIKPARMALDYKKTVNTGMDN